MLYELGAGCEMLQVRGVDRLSPDRKVTVLIPGEGFGGVAREVSDGVQSFPVDVRRLWVDGRLVVEGGDTGLLGWFRRHACFVPELNRVSDVARLNGWERLWVAAGGVPGLVDGGVGGVLRMCGRFGWDTLVAGTESGAMAVMVGDGAGLVVLGESPVGGSGLLMRWVADGVGDMLCWWVRCGGRPGVFEEFAAGRVPAAEVAAAVFEFGATR